MKYMGFTLLCFHKEISFRKSFTSKFFENPFRNSVFAQVLSTGADDSPLCST